MKYQYDYGAGASAQLTFPAGAKGCKIYADGAGGGRGGAINNYGGTDTEAAQGGYVHIEVW